MSRLLTALCVALVLAFAGCGGDGDSTDSTDTAASQGPTTAGEGTTPNGSESTAPTSEDPGEGSGKDAEAKGEGNGAKPDGGGQAAKIIDAGGAKVPAGKPPAEPAEFEAPTGGDDSVQTFGETIDGEDEEEVIVAMRSFFTALATLDYPAVCAGLTEANRESLQVYLKAKGTQGGCEEVLEELLLTRAAPEARQAANASVYEVRVEDDTAFVLFTPEGGTASFFVMKNEDGWKSTGLGFGTPFDPTAG